VLEAALSRFGDDVCLLEMLAECLNRFDPKGKLEGVLESLRSLAPESDAFAERRHPGDQDKRVLDARVDRLRAMLDFDNPALREAILRDMHRVVAAMPSRLHYRFLYAAALAACGETDRALAQTDILAEFQSDSHDQHFIVADLYRRLGRADLARPHLNAAIRNASGEDDIADALEMKEQLDAAP